MSTPKEKAKTRAAIFVLAGVGLLAVVFAVRQLLPPSAAVKNAVRIVVANGHVDPATVLVPMGQAVSISSGDGKNHELRPATGSAVQITSGHPWIKTFSQAGSFSYRVDAMTLTIVVFANSNSAPVNISGLNL